MKKPATLLKARSDLWKKGLLAFACICFGILFHAPKLVAQKQEPNFTITSYLGGSDWYVRLRTQGAALNCWGTDTYSYSIYNNGALLRNELTPNRAGELPDGHIIPVSWGPDRGGSWHVVYRTEGSSFNCLFWRESNRITISTTALRAPATLTASDSTSASALRNEITLTWTKGTDTPNQYHSYWIYRDGDFSSPFAEVAGNIRTWTDKNLAPGEKHTYSVVTRIDHDVWGQHVSPPIEATGNTYSGIRASDGGSARSVNIIWPEMNGAAGSVKIFRDGVEVLPRVSPEALLMRDIERVPGLKHSYTLIPYDAAGAAFATYTDVGHAALDGLISGSVKAPFGGAVIGATVYAQRITDEEQDEDHPQLYSDVTNGNGEFEIPNIYYHSEATFKVYVEKGDHVFDPASYDEIILREAANHRALPSPSFVDVSSVTVQGMIFQKAKGDEADMEGVEILIDGQYLGTKTDENGVFSLTVEELGEYTFEPRYSDHSFSPAAITKTIEFDVFDLNFEDTQKQTLSGSFLGACDTYFGEATLNIYSTKNPERGIDTVIVTQAGLYSVQLPAREYTMEVLAFAPEPSHTVTGEEVTNFFDKSEIDLTDGSKEKNYVFREPPKIEITGFPFAGCAPFDVPVMEQLVMYVLEIKVLESMGAASCATSSGYVVIYDEVQDGNLAPDTLFLENGMATYEVLAGEPNLLDGGEHPYQKKIVFDVNVEGQRLVHEQYVLIEGNRPREQTFVTTSPEVPFLILRDPPGDESYSYLSEKTKFDLSMMLYAQASGSVNVWKEVKLGVEQEAGVGVIIPYKIWGKVKTSLEVGASLKSQVEYGVEFTTENKFATSGNQEITGSDGDVFVGFAMNMRYALTDVIRYDAETCAVLVSQEMIMGTEGFATTFIYTEQHIEEILIPQLESIVGIYEKRGSDSAVLYTNQIDVWQQTLAANAKLKEDAEFIQNKSFSAGAGSEFAETFTSTESLSIEFNLFVEATVAAEAGAEVGGNGGSVGADVKFRMEVGGSLSSGVTHEKTVGYSLNDDDVGDYFSVDVKADPVYGTPVFDLVSGRSSCPWERGTQPREGTQLTINKKVQYDVDKNSAAAFRLTLGNTSQSDEDGIYNLVFLQESNPEGAVLTLGGSQVQGGVLTPYNVPAGGTVDVTVTVASGPQSDAYQDLKFALLSSCGDGIISDTVSFSVFFKSNCSSINLSKPLAHWQVNGDDNNHLPVEVSGYDKSKLNDIALQYKDVNSGIWETDRIVSASELLENSTVIDWDVADVVDGDYGIRVKVACGQDNSEYSFSNTVNGSIDRAAPVLFGVPEPTNGRYQTGDEISATFDEALNCFGFSTDNVICKDKMSGTVYPVAVGCTDNKVLIVPLTDDVFEDQVMEISLIDIQDNQGNVRDDMITWGFDIANASFKIDGTSDSDGDGILNADDNCPFTANPEQEDMDDDGLGDVCDEDLDGDNADNNTDNCPYSPNADQQDQDGNGVGDACDLDVDNDGIANEIDNCPTTANPDQADADEDGTGDACHVVTGVGDEVNSQRAMHLYPNPASHEINVSFEVEVPAHVAVSILDLAGREIQPVVNDKFPSGKYQYAFSVQGLDNGLYILQICKNGKKQARKLFIQK